VLWLAGTLGKRCRKLTKKRILQADIPQLAKEIIFKGKSTNKEGSDAEALVDLIRKGQLEENEFSLRVTSTLLLGVVVIFNKKAQYVLADGNHMMHVVRQQYMSMIMRGGTVPGTEPFDLNRSVSRFETITMKKASDLDLINPMLLLNDEEVMRRWYDFIGANEQGELMERQHGGSGELDVTCELDGKETYTVSGGLVYDQPGGVESAGEADKQNGKSLLISNEDAFMEGLDIFDDEHAITKIIGGGDITELGGLDPIIEEERNGEQQNDQPLDTSASSDNNPKKRKRKPGKLIIDDVIQISGDDMRAMIEDCSSILTTRRSLPPDCNIFQYRPIFEEAMLNVFNDTYDKQTMDILYYAKPGPFQSEATIKMLESHYYSRTKRTKRNHDEEIHLDGELPVGDNMELGGLDMGELEMPRSQPMDEHLATHPYEPEDADTLSRILRGITPSISPTKDAPEMNHNLNSPEKRGLSIGEPNELQEFFDSLNVEDRSHVNISLLSEQGMIKKSWNMLSYLQEKTKQQQEETTVGNTCLSFKKILGDNQSLSHKRRKERAAQCFYQLLVLASNGKINFENLDSIEVNNM